MTCFLAGSIDPLLKTLYLIWHYDADKIDMNYQGQQRIVINRRDYC